MSIMPITKQLAVYSLLVFLMLKHHWYVTSHQAFYLLHLMFRNLVSSMQVRKNIGPAGLTIVIIRDDLLDQAKAEIPSILKYADQAKNGSMVNTPSTYAWYLSGLVFEWLLEQGGVDAIHKVNLEKAQLLYGYIDSSDFYNNPIAIPNRSIMNVPFTLADEALEKQFLKEAEENHLLNLAGHRSVGGMRASIYNAVPLEGVQALIRFMDDFAKRNG